MNQSEDALLLSLAEVYLERGRIAAAEVRDRAHVKAEISSCLGDVLSAVSYSCKERLYHSPCTPEVLAYEYDRITKERKVEKETADTWDGPCETELHCETCGESHTDIITRGPSGAGWRLDSLSVFIPDISEDQLTLGRRPKECYAAVMCQSCILEKENPEEVLDGYGERCSACGITNLLCCDEDVVEDFFHYNTYRGHGMCGFCPSCSENLSEQEKAEKLYDRRERLSIPHYQDYEALLHAEVQRNTAQSLVDEGTSDPSDDDLELNDSDEEDRLYGDSQEWDEEYENEELPENNTEKAKKIKETIRNVGEKMFDLKDLLKEGDYLEIMDLLQTVTNEVNSL